MTGRVGIESVELPAQVAEVVRYAMDCGWWPWDDKKDIAYFLKVWGQFGKIVPLLETFMALELWQLDNPTPKGKRQNVRLRFHTFCRKAADWKTLQNRQAHSARIEKRKPKPPQGNAQRMNDLAAVLANKQTLPKNQRTCAKSQTGNATTPARLETREELRARRMRELEAKPKLTEAELQRRRVEQLAQCREQRKEHGNP